MTRRNYKTNRLFVLNDPTAPRICPALAKEIGLNESILFLQWEFWLVTEGVERNGDLWLRKTVREVAAAFPFWSIQTAQRVIESLLAKKLFIAADLDDGPGRSARWMRFNFDQVAVLNSVRVLSHSETTLSQSDDESAQSETPAINKKKNKDRVVKPEDLIAPFNSDDFTQALALFEAGRMQKRAGKLTDVARMLMYRKFREWGEQRSIAALLHSAEKGYTGCFEPNNGVSNAANQRHNSSRPDAAGTNSETSTASYDPFRKQRAV